MSIKGFPSQKKATKQLIGFTPEQSENKNEFVTAQPTYSDRVGLDSVQLGLYRTHAAPKTATPQATEPKRVFTSAAHGALKGDVIRFMDTATNPSFESGVLAVPDANTIILNSETPLNILGTDTFYVLRYVVPRYDQTGATIATFTQGPTQFVLNAVNTDVSQDTGTPANSRPLPVKVLNPDGTDVTPSTAANQAAQSVLIGPVTEAVPATDTASSGLNGRLQRIAQKFTSLISLFPVTIGQKAMTGSLSVALASDQSSIPVTGAFYQGTQPVSAATLPLPAGASTSALQTTGNTSVASIDTKTPALGQALAAASVPVVLTAAQIITLTPPTAVTANAGTNLNTSALALETTQSAISGKLPTTLGQKTSTNSLAVTIASDQTTVPAKLSGKAIANAPVRNDYTSVNVTTAAYVQLVASLTSAVTELEIFDSSGCTLVLATGAAASEVNQIYIFPGGNGRVPLSIAAGVRVSIKAISANATVGEIDINFYS